jgi:hypothetical protein
LLRDDGIAGVDGMRVESRVFSDSDLDVDKEWTSNGEELLFDVVPRRMDVVVLPL